ncbi:hypothetical protein CCYA_CCYA02G0701 [Cyanidiococcus yangmingshanensis]|nr:hypothetical protein CCYA_CCYA02G0701 [Cyanidiococcus yangmingshanensis]
MPEIEETESLQDSSRLEAALDAFIRSQLERVFGPELATQFWKAQRPLLQVEDRLAFIRKRWIGVFHDSPLALFGKKRIEALERLSRAESRGDALSGEERRQLQSELAQLLKYVSTENSKHTSGHAVAKRVLEQSEPEYVEEGVDSFASEPGAANDDAVEEAMLVESPDASTAMTCDGLETLSSDKMDSRKMPLAVFDGENIAWAHARNAHFSPRGIALAVTFFQERGYRCVVFLPNYRRQCAALPFADKHDMLVFTPPGDYDDTYALSYALRYDAILVTNDRLQDHLDQFSDDEVRTRESMRQWLGSHRCSFTFVGEEFVPNPHFFLP